MATDLTPYRILMVPDVPGWAWHRRALALQKYAPPEFQVDIVMEEHFFVRDLDDYDAAVFFSWPSCPMEACRRGTPAWAFVANAGCMHDFPDNSNFLTRTSSRIKNRKTAQERLPQFTGILTVNPATVDFLRSTNSNTHWLRTGVDTSVFEPRRPLMQRSELHVGWCGKPSQGDRFSPKGYETVLLTLMEMTKDSPIAWHINTRTHEDALNTSEMVDWYNSLDLFLCTSCSEGTPSSLMEAAACGRPFLSTRVGIVPEILKQDWGSGSAVGSYVDSTGAKQCAKAMAIYLEVTSDCHRRHTMQGAVKARGERARKAMVEGFSWSNLAAQWLNTIKNYSHTKVKDGMVHG